MLQFLQSLRRRKNRQAHVERLIALASLERRDGSAREVLKTMMVDGNQELTLSSWLSEAGGDEGAARR